MFTDKDEVQALYAMYRAIEEKKVVFNNHGSFTSLVGASEGIEGFWIVGFYDQDAFFVPKVVVETLAPMALPSFTPAVPEDDPLTASPEIWQRVVDVVRAAKDARSVRVYEKYLDGPQNHLTTIQGGSDRETVVAALKDARKRSTAKTVMAEVVSHTGQRVLTRSFPLPEYGAK